MIFDCTTQGMLDKLDNNTSSSTYYLSFEGNEVFEVKYKTILEKTNSYFHRLFHGNLAHSLNGKSITYLFNLTRKRA